MNKVVPILGGQRSSFYNSGNNHFLFVKRDRIQKVSVSTENIIQIELRNYIRIFRRQGRDILLPKKGVSRIGSMGFRSVG